MQSTMQCRAPTMGLQVNYSDFTFTRVTISSYLKKKIILHVI